ncbi:AraC family transcriptional regulator [Pseudomonas typographi]|uniref:Helix-turn-helix transcriptional regulator n=1 Tax=Pseudomonas typographi TaxID=2715964 RepID=A0ABR7Z731_9PSED|nr:AraC family transcriptional regulator [Pseudomonas typographi]MBD1551110.1 helix-turn-helix transcriptional regulator [Pseudomonas typographi]MBD1586396.1 helix-turn-helix transcriptional regulator [Pseudomonas typographi]MBD1601355.1 helix-turn-helix transcriptional regulator [Pseudomonas typographi]
MDPIISLKSYAEGASLHVHDFHQLVIPTNGTMEIEINGSGGYLTNARGVLIPAACHHEFSASSGSQYVVADIPIDFMMGDSVDSWTSRTVNEPFFTVPLSFNHLLAYLKDAGQQRHAVNADAWVRLALGSIASDPQAPCATKPEPLAKATAFMRANIDQAITCKHVALAAGVSERKLNYLFHQSMQATPHAYLLELRIERAISLLCSGNLPISAIAHASGFSDQSALTHAMKRTRGITPAKLRRVST